MSLLDDPLFAELRAEATQWHLTQSATVRRYGTMLVNGRDQPTEVLIFYGLVGVNRREGQGGYFLIEFPHTAKLRPGDVVVLAVPDLRTGDRAWWPWTCVAGLLLGVLARLYLRRGRGNAAAAVLSSGAQSGETSSTR